jgi:hypothetical protein
MPRRWTEGEKRVLIALRDHSGLSFAEIAKAFDGSTADTCKSLYFNLKFYRAAGGRKTAARSDPVAARVLDEVIEERNARLALRLARTDLTATFFGDPLPGYSELDARRGVKAAVAPQGFDRRKAQLASKPTLYWGKLGEVRA